MRSRPSRLVWGRGDLVVHPPGVWKSKHPKTGKTTYVSNTHHASPTLKQAIKETS